MNALSNITYPQALVISLVLAGLLYFFEAVDLGTQKKDQIAGVVSEIEAKNSEIIGHEKVIARAEEFKSLQNSVGSEVDRVLNFIPKTLAGAELMRQISIEARSSGVNLVRIAEGGVTPFVFSNLSLFESLNINIEIDGSFSAIALFLANLTRIDKLILVNDLDVSRRDQAERAGVRSLGLTATLGTLRYAPQAEAPAEAAAPNAEGG